jgi:FkbM family methyltransferase
MALGNLVVKTMSLCPPVTRRLLARILRSGVPVPSNAGWIVFNLKQTLVPARNTLRRVQCAGGLTMEVDLRTSVGREIYYHGSYEPSVAGFLHENLSEGHVMLDCGANVGELSLLAARAVGPRGRVLAIEPSPHTAAVLRRNVAINSVKNVEVIEAALTDRDTDQTFFLGKEIHSLSSALWRPEDFQGEKLTVRGKTVSTLLDERGICRLDLVKMDIEGAELAALRGAELAFRRLERLPILIFEYNKAVANRAGWALRDVWALLAPWGYELSYLEEGKPRRPCRVEDDLQLDRTAKIDVVCTPAERRRL